MTEELIFSQVQKVRNGTLRVAQGVTGEEAAVVPPGFNNSIQWHLGHIFTIQERRVFGLTGSESGTRMPEGFPGWFGNGTKPAEWQSAPPSLDDLLDLLKEQPTRIQQSFTGQLDVKLQKPFYKLDSISIGEMLMLDLLHEKEHVGFINALKRVVAK
jgi:hypothetical protein